MSYAILRHGKIKSAGKGAAISHNHRLSDDAKINIDKAKAHLNIFFDGDGAKDRIDAKTPAKHRKDAVIAVEILLTSGPEFFDAIETDREKLAVDPKFVAWVEQSIGWAKKEFGANIVDAVLHMDESTPHIHILTVPLTRDGRLCAKEVTARAEMQRRQTDYAEVMTAFGLERGTPASETKREHIPLKGKPGSGGKAAQEAKAQAGLLAKTVAELAKLEKRTVRQQTLNVANLHLINKLEAEAKIMVKALATASERDHELVAEITALRAENEHAQASLEQLRAIDRVIVDQTRERMAQEAQEALQGAQEALQGAQEAFAEKWAGVPEVTAARVVGSPVVDVCGRRVVYSLGRGKHAIHTFEQGVEVPKLAQAEQEKKGVAR